MQPATAADTGDEVKIISLVSVGHGFSHFYMLVLPPLFPLIRADFDSSWLAIGLFLTTYGISTSICQIPAGLLVDRFGARNILVGGMAIYAGAYFLIAFTSAYWMIFPLMAVAGIGNAAFHPADYAVLSERIGQMRVGRAYSIHTFSGFVGWMVAPPLMLFVATQADWRAAVAVAGILGLLFAGAMFWWRDLLETGHVSNEPDRTEDAGKKSGLGLLTTLPILLLLAFFTLNSLGGGGIQNFSVVAMMDLYGATLGQANAALTGYLIAGGAGVLVGGYLADRTNRHELLTVICLGAGCIMVAVAGFPELTIAGGTAAVALGGFLIGIIGPSRDIMVRKLSPRNSIGTAFGIVTTGFTVGGIVAPFIYGVVNDLGRPELVYFIGATFQVLAILTVLDMRRRKRGAAERETTQA
ncbi:MAG: MFS transporter [Alphaproteobacteria bacterium]